MFYSNGSSSRHGQFDSRPLRFEAAQLTTTSQRVPTTTTSQRKAASGSSTAAAAAATVIKAVRDECYKTFLYKTSHRRHGL